jgi:hypothetical protein
MASDGQLHAPAALSIVFIVQEAGWVPGAGPDGYGE